MKILSERQSDVIAGKWPEEHKPTTESPNLETIVEDDLEDDTNDEVHMFHMSSKFFVAISDWGRPV